MSNIYIDAGFYRGMTLRKYIDQGTIDKSWTIYAFEANPDLSSKQFIKDFFPDVSIKLIEKAVWVEDGRVTFDIGGREDSGCIEGTAGHTEPKKLSVPSVDFSKFVSKLPKVHIICSMDIEGAEFKVLEKMLEEDTIDKIDLLDVEFHHRLTIEYEPDDARKLIKQIKKHGVEVKLKGEVGMSKVTAIIPSLIDVDGEYLKLCVESLRESGFDGDIIAVANGTKDMSPFRDIKGITKGLTVKRQGQCFAVNQGAKMVEGDCKYLFIINADMYFAPGWDKNLHFDYKCFSPNLIEPTNNAGSAPPFLKRDWGVNLEEFKKERADTGVRSLLQIMKPNDHKDEILPREETGFNLPFFIDIDLWRTIEGYDEFYDPWSSNSDTDLQTLINLAGVTPMRLRDVLVYHFSSKSGTFDGSHQEEWQKNFDYYRTKFGYTRDDEPKADVWYNKNMVLEDKLKFQPDWKDKYFEL